MRAWRLLAVLALGVSILAVEAAQAQPPQTVPRTVPRAPYRSTHSTMKLDKPEIVKAAVAAMAEGTRLFQTNQAYECYLTYSFTVSSIVWSLDHDKDLQQRVVYRMIRASNAPTFEQGAVELRTALNDIRNRNDVLADGKTEQSLFYRLGGQDAVQSIVKMTYDRANNDTKVNLSRDGEFPYKGDRPQRMQKATVDMIKRLSDKGKPVLDAKEAAPQDKELAKRLSDLTQKQTDLNTKLKAVKDELSKLPVGNKKRAPLLENRADFEDRLAVVSTHLADVQRLIDLQNQVAGLKAGPSTGASDLDALVGAHRALRITDDEYTAAVQIFRDSLEAHSIPDQEYNELIKLVQSLRPSIVHNHGHSHK